MPPLQGSVFGGVPFPNAAGSWEGALARAAQRLRKVALLRVRRGFIVAGIRHQRRAVRPQRWLGIRTEAPRRRHLREAYEQHALDILGEHALERREVGVRA